MLIGAKPFCAVDRPSSRRMKERRRAPACSSSKRRKQRYQGRDIDSFWIVDSRRRE